MLRAVRRNWFSYDLDVFDRTGTRVATADLANWRENAKLEVGGKRYLARHEMGSKDFVLEGEDGLTVALAEKPSVLRESFSLEHGAGRYEVRKESPWKSSFVISREGMGVVGSIKQGSIFGGETTVDLPEELPIEVQVFVLWLATVMRKRADSAAGSTASM